MTPQEVGRLPHTRKCGARALVTCSAKDIVRTILEKGDGSIGLLKYMINLKLPIKEGGSNVLTYEWLAACHKSGINS